MNGVPDVFGIYLGYFQTIFVFCVLVSLSRFWSFDVALNTAFEVGHSLLHRLLNQPHADAVDFAVG